MTSLIAAWHQIQPLIKETIGDHSYTTWFAHITPESKQEGHLLLVTPDEFFKNWVVDNYLGIIKDALLKETGAAIEISVVIEKRGGAAIIPAVEKTGSPAPVMRRNHSSGNIQARFSFDNFVVGNSNRMAYAASRAVSDNDPGKAYNPLFIYGQSGLGKTHLMQAIANQVTRRNPSLTCLYLTSETFTNELISAIQHKSTNAFRQKYRSVDVLLIDDIQFLAGKVGMQEEFFHTFNALHNNHKQIIISSDRPAKELADLEDRLVTRFQMGLATDIQPPDFETRVAILRKKNDLAGVNVPDDVIFFIAENIKTNIRQLEGSLIKVNAFATLQDKKVTLQIAQDILKDMINESMRIISIEMVQQAVAEHYKITVNDLCSSKRKQNIAIPRQIAMYLIRKTTRHSLPEIGRAFGGKDHSTVLYSCKKIEEDINNSSEIKYSIEKLSAVLQQ